MADTRTLERGFGIGGSLIFTFLATMYFSIIGTFLGLLVTYMSHEEAVNEIKRLRHLIPVDPNPPVKTTPESVLENPQNKRLSKN